MLTNYKKGLTKEEVKSIVKDWDTLTLQELSEKYQRPISTFMGICARLKKRGIVLTPKNSKARSGSDKFWDEAAADIISQSLFTK